jgi:hypothetical protein
MNRPRNVTRNQSRTACRMWSWNFVITACKQSGYSNGQKDAGLKGHAYREWELGMDSPKHPTHEALGTTTTGEKQDLYRGRAKHRTTLIIAPANIFVLDDVFAWFIVPLIAVGVLQFVPPMYWTLRNLNDSENKQ